MSDGPDYVLNHNMLWSVCWKLQNLVGEFYPSVFGKSIEYRGILRTEFGGSAGTCQGPARESCKGKGFEESGMNCGRDWLQVRTRWAANGEMIR